MKTTIVKWDESMAARCLARVERHPVKKEYTAPAVKIKATAPVSTAVPAITIEEEAPSIDIATGEWDGFEYALNNALKKKHN